jgi:hypothetical protein
MRMTIAARRDIGTVAHAVAVTLAAMQSLPNKQSRHIALGQVLARLSETHNIDGTGSVLLEVISNINHYQHVSD